MENRKTVCLQGHIDMVCEKNNDVEFDFENDPLNLYIDGDWVKAKGTTLGADNGIGVAMAMAVMASDNVPHPAMEALFTLDEETGLTGATHLDKNVLDAKILINIDSEEESTFTIGCAGGINTIGHFKYEEDTIQPSEFVGYELNLKGLRGGHSGIEINDGRGNSIKFLARFLWNLGKEVNFRLSSFVSGNKHNAIPREGVVTLAVQKSQEKLFLSLVEKYNAIFKNEYATKEPDLNMTAKSIEMPKRVTKFDFQNRLINSLYVAPHGVSRMNPDIPTLVQTSTNLAIIETRPDEFFVLTCQRSSAESEKAGVMGRVTASFVLGGAVVESNDGYPGWEPNVNSEILNLSKEIYKKVMGREPKIEAIHAGLECGLIGEKHEGMDMLSIGPNLKDVHSPAEKVQISSVERIYNLLLEILKNTPVK
jgi:dipeptidase D